MAISVVESCCRLAVYRSITATGAELMIVESTRINHEIRDTINVCPLFY